MPWREARPYTLVIVVRSCKTAHCIQSGGKHVRRLHVPGEEQNSGVVATLRATHCCKHGAARERVWQAPRTAGPRCDRLREALREVVPSAPPALHPPPTSTHCTSQVIDIYVMKTCWRSRD
ncbi:hypothetical protein E2C01_018284 [Portunus trituberculatus]|uniref:Uncharacterized protein n=1 Tax=Portunus trituberculatus TaxID=210409 RepID=A0A5B7DUL9_PORTR|nr:hypothetical protein [Portunus trituberculatus]